MEAKLVKKQEGTMDNTICYPLNLIVHESHNISVLHIPFVSEPHYLVWYKSLKITLYNIVFWMED